MIPNAKRSFVYICMLLPILLTAQTTLSDFFTKKNIAPKAAEDFFYSIERQGSGAIPKRGDYVKVKYVGKLLDGTVFDQSEQEPFVFHLGYREVVDGWERGVPLFKVGTKGTLYLPPNRAYGSRKNGNIPENSALLFEIEVMKVMNSAEYEQYNIDLEKREKVAFEQAKKNQIATDDKIIQQFLAEKNIKASKTKTGLYYVVTKKGKGETAKIGETIVTEYEGFLPDGTVFDSTKDKVPFQFALGAKKVLKGWEEGFGYLSKNSEGYLLLPSALAYGNLAIKENNVPSNAVLIFKIKVKDIKKM